MSRDRRIDPDRVLVLIERNDDGAGMEYAAALARFAALARTVDRIADDRPAHGGAMHP